MQNKFNFNIALSVLNQLGRNLYRTFPTVLGEAISNSWDANAENVHIVIDRKNNLFWIKDDGCGMDEIDFQEKFLRIGHSKRRGGEMLSPDPYRRPYIGNKGIGKLALLSCAVRVSIISRKSAKNEYIGGVIDNVGLDKAIIDDLEPHDYPLGIINDSLFKDIKKDHKNGTIICFENIHDDVQRTDDFLKKIIALYFRFSLLDPKFNIYLTTELGNDELITIGALEQLAVKTEFLWLINNREKDTYVDLLKTKIKSDGIINLSMKSKVSGFIASVSEPKDRNIHSTGEKVGVDLFVNGRMRETDILRHIPTARIAENYLYGQIHFDILDSDGKDRFISSREGVLSTDPLYKDFLQELKTTIGSILGQWNELRDKRGRDGELDSKYKKAKSLTRDVIKNYMTGDKETDNFTTDLIEDGTFNVESYVECFAAENLLRRYIKDNNNFPNNCTKINPSTNQTCLDRELKEPCEYCLYKRDYNGFKTLKENAKIKIPIREDEESVMLYLDYITMANFIEKKFKKGEQILKNEDNVYKPLRNSVMHTSRLTKEAKIRLRGVFDNIVATIKQLTN